MGNRYIYDQHEEITGTDRDEMEAALSRGVDERQAGGFTSLQMPVQGEFPVTLRRAVISDSRFIGRLSRDVFTIYGPYEEVLSGWFKSDKGITTIIACRNKIQIGFAMLSEPSDRYDLQDASELLGIAVEPEKQGKGVGELLLGAIHRTSAFLNIKWLFLHTAVDNMPAQRLFKRTGYRPLEVKRNFYPEGQDAIVMYRDITRMF